MLPFLFNTSSSPHGLNFVRYIFHTKQKWSHPPEKLINLLYHQIMVSTDFRRSWVDQGVSDRQYFALCLAQDTPYIGHSMLSALFMILLLLLLLLLLPFSLPSLPLLLLLILLWSGSAGVSQAMLACDVTWWCWWTGNISNFKVTITYKIVVK